MSVSSHNALSLGGRLEQLALAYADHPALISAERSISFAELARGARTVARALTRYGVGKDTRVGLLMPNRPEWLQVAFGVWRLGATLVPINTLFRKTELAYTLQHADVSVLIMVPSFLSHNYATMLAELCEPATAGVLRCSSLPLLRTILVDGACDWTGAHAWADALADSDDIPSLWEDSMLERVSPYEDATIFSTSGSTAAPKGVVHTHASMSQAAHNVGARLGLTADDRTYGYLPFFFNGGLVGVALATLWRGGAVLLQEVFNADDALALLEQRQCTTIFAWPHQAEALVALPQFDRQRLHIHKGVGANTKWAARLYPPTHQAISTWGMTETGPMAACTRWDEPLSDRIASHGVAMPGLEMRIVDPTTGAECPPGSDGEMVVRGSSVMRTYYKVARDQCFDTDGYFHTGDCGHLDEAGRLHFIGRIKDVIKTAGVNVAAAEVEAVILTHPGVKVAHVVPVPHPTRGENVAAFVVCSADGASADSIIAHCAAQLASYKVPRHVFVCDESELPVLGSGKVDRQALRRRATELAATTS